MCIRDSSYALAGAFGAVVNTGLVMGLMGTVLSGAFAAAQGISHDLVSGAILGIVLANGVPETIAAVALTTAICLAVTKAAGFCGAGRAGKERVS